jgi:cytochrome b561
VAAIGWLVYLIVLLAAFIVLSRIRTRVMQNATQSVGVVPSVSRFAVGAACGLLLVICLVVPTILFSEAFQSDPNQLAAEFQGSITFPILKSISNRAQTWMQGVLPQSLEEAPPASPTP